MNAIRANRLPWWLLANAVREGEVRLCWADVKGASGYNVYWDTTPDVTPADGNKVAGVHSPFIHGGLTNGVAYHYVVTATYMGGESVPSAEVEAMPQGPVPGGSFATAGDGSNTNGSVPMRVGI